ncbi:MAG: glycosyltransferase [Spirochaetales bacterium]|nr:glycosyltransferase [Spirochaetales bacterium]
MENRKDPVPLISVVIPVYNRPQMLDAAVRSVLDQSFADFELIVVDDGSEPPVDGRRWGDLRVRVIRAEHTGMPGAARNRGIREAAGRYLAFLDSDDRWLSEKLELQLPVLTGAAAGKPASAPPSAPAGPGQARAASAGGHLHGAPRLCHTRERWVRAGKEISQKGQGHRREGRIFSDALKKCIIGPSTVLAERELFLEYGGFREDLEVAEDYELWLRVTACEEVAYLDRPLTVKQAGDWDQLSAKYGSIEYFRIEALRPLVEDQWFKACGKGSESRGDGLAGGGRAAERREGEELQRLAAAELARKCRIYAAGSRKRGKPGEAAEYEEAARRAERQAGV